MAAGGPGLGGDLQGDGGQTRRSSSPLLRRLVEDSYCIHVLMSEEALLAAYEDVGKDQGELPSAAAEHAKPFILLTGNNQADDEVGGTLGRGRGTQSRGHTFCATLLREAMEGAGQCLGPAHRSITCSNGRRKVEGGGAGVWWEFKGIRDGRRSANEGRSPTGSCRYEFTACPPTLARATRALSEV